MRTAVAGSLALAAIVLLGQSAQAQLLEKKAAEPRSAITGAASSRSSTMAAGSFCSSAWTMRR